MAGFGSFCQPWRILFRWNSGCGIVGFLVELERKGTLDWDCSWFISSGFSAFCHHNLYQLGKEGQPSTSDSFKQFFNQLLIHLMKLSLVPILVYTALCHVYVLVV